MTAQYDVCRLPEGSLVVVVQADVVGMYETKVVVPLVVSRRRRDDRWAARATADGSWEMRLLATHLVSVVRKHDLSPPVASLDGERLAIQSALDLLPNGS